MTDILPPDAYALTPTTDDSNAPTPLAALRIDLEDAPKEVTVVSRTELTDGSVLEHYA